MPPAPRPALPPVVLLAHVEPGQLLTADFVNMLIDAINALGDRVAALERKRRKAPGP